MGMGKYIITKSNVVALMLKTYGYTLLSEKDGVFTFMNDGRVTLAADEKREVSYTNKIFL